MSANHYQGLIQAYDSYFAFRNLLYFFLHCQSNCVLEMAKSSVFYVYAGEQGRNCILDYTICSGFCRVTPTNHTHAHCNVQSRRATPTKHTRIAVSNLSSPSRRRIQRQGYVYAYLGHRGETEGEQPYFHRSDIQGKSTVLILVPELFRPHSLGTGGCGLLSLAGAVISIICRDKSMLVATKLLSRQTFLSRQIFVVTKVFSRLVYFCRDKNDTCGSSRQPQFTTRLHFLPSVI